MSIHPFTVIPAIDIAGGRLASPSGAERASVLGDDLSSVLAALAAAGATWVHLVDLDRARGAGANVMELADAVRQAHEHGMKVQLSGGIVDLLSFDAALALEPDRVNVACEALLDVAWLSTVFASPPCDVNFCLDVRGDHVLARGSGVDCGPLDTALDVLLPMQPRIVVTDVDADGALSGPPLELIRVVADRGFEVLASGGVRDAADVQSLRRLAELGVSVVGVIVGAAIHTGALQLRDA